MARLRDIYRQMMAQIDAFKDTAPLRGPQQPDHVFGMARIRPILFTYGDNNVEVVMIPWRTIAVAAMAGTLCSAAAAASVKVTLVAPKQFSDRDFRSASERDAAINELRRHFEWLGKRYLRQGEELAIDILDIGLAGELRPFPRGASDVRVLTDVTPPRIRLRYTLRANGRVTLKGVETISDINYLSRSRVRATSERLGYEKEMLRDWFELKFAGARPRS